MVAARPLHVFSVDVEDWYHSNFQSAPSLAPEEPERRVEHGIARILELLDAYGARATFFVLGTVAQKHPTLVGRIVDAGHEIACHSWEHRLLYEQTRAEICADLARARALLQDQSGQAVRGFRAPSWSITERNLWALDVISEVGFSYDSSIFPAATHLYGIQHAPRYPYRLRTLGSSTLVEIPPSSLQILGRRIGVGGGVYLRALPLALHRRALAECHARTQPFVAYVHPRELDPGSWHLKLDLSPFEALIHRFGLRRVEPRVRRLLGLVRWEPFERLVEMLEPAASAS